MGNIVRFQPKGEGAHRKTEEILMRIGEHYQQKLKARDALPGALARLVREGRHELALEALLAWGEHQLEPHEVLASIARQSGSNDQEI